MTATHHDRRPFLRPALSLALAAVCLAQALPARAQDAYGGGAPAAQPASPTAPPQDEEKKLRIVHPIDKRVSRYLSAALKLMQDNKLAEADETLEKIAGNQRLNPTERAKLQQFLGNVAIYKNDLPDAAKHMQEALKLEGLDLASEQQVTFQLASIYAQLSDFPKAMQVLDLWFQSATNPTPEAFYLRAVILVQMEKVDEAVLAAEQAVALSPDPREGWLSLLAHSYYLTKNYAKMASTLETLIAKSPNKKTYWLLLSAAYFELDRDEEARSIVQLAYRQGLLDKDREVRALVRLLIANGMPYEAAGVMEKGMADSLVPKERDSYELLTNAFLQARADDRALEPLKKGAEASEDAQLYILLGKVYLQSERFSDAIAALNVGLTKAKPDQRGRVYLLIGVAQLGAKRLDDAERAFRSALGDEKTRKEADNYLKFVTQERERRQGMGA